MRTILEFTRLHASEKIQVFFDAAIAIWTVLAGLGQRAPVFADLVGGQAVDVGLAHLDKSDGRFIELIEVIGRVAEAVLPVEAQPADVPLDRLDILLALLAGIGVVEAQKRTAAVLGSHAEVQADGFRMPDVQETIRLRREAGDDGVVLSAREVIGDDLANEISGLCIAHSRGQSVAGCAIVRASRFCTIARGSILASALRKNAKNSIT